MRVLGAVDGVRSGLSCGPGSEVADRRAHSRKPAVLRCALNPVSLALVTAPRAPWKRKVEVPRRVGTYDMVPRDLSYVPEIRFICFFCKSMSYNIHEAYERTICCKWFVV